MEKKVLVYSHKMNGPLDDDYTLYEDGEVLHEYDKHTYPGGYNLTEKLQANKLKESVKERLLSAASPKNIDLVRSLLGI